jgi:hypothetical protein
MEAIIKSTVLLPYDSEDGSTAIINVEVTDMHFEIKKGRFVASLEHYYWVGTGENAQKVTIKQRNSPYLNVEIASLFRYLNNDILVNDNFPDEFTSLIAQSLLFEFQMITYADGLCAYRSQPQDWVINTDPDPVNIND